MPEARLGRLEVDAFDDHPGGVGPPKWVGQRVQAFRIEDEARKLSGTNFIVSSRFKAHAVRDGVLITGQQQYSGAVAARLMIEALGV